MFMKPVVVIPTYNEADNVAEFTAALLALPVPSLEILIVDDESPDGTGQIADQFVKASLDRVHVLHRLGPRGLGRAYIDGFRWAMNHGADRLIQMDADFSHAPSCIPSLLDTSRDCDVIVGSRYTQGGALDPQWGLGRTWLSAWANLDARSILGLQVLDATAGFKCWTREAVERINLDRVRSDGYVFQVEMAYLTERIGLRVREVPIYFEDRRIGQSKISVSVKFEAMWRVWQVKWRHRCARRDDARVTALVR